MAALETLPRSDGTALKQAGCTVHTLDIVVAFATLFTESEKESMKAEPTMKNVILTTILAFTAIVFSSIFDAGAEPTKDKPMSQNKLTVNKYMDAFNKTDHAAILSCLTEDVEWVLPGAFHKVGKVAFDKEIENDAFVGSPTIKVTRLTEENNVVVAEGNVRCTKKDGVVLKIVFCDVFEMQDAKVRRLTSYLMETKE